MGENLCDIFLKEYETSFPIHGMIQSSYGKSKTPYQLDLETMRRKPDIVPKVGDRVKIKSRDWYEKWKDPKGTVDVYLFFTEGMSHLCGEIFTIRNVVGSEFFLENDPFSFLFSLEMFEEVYPVLELPKIDFRNACLDQSHYTVNGGELILSPEKQKRLARWMNINPKLKQVKTTHLIKLKKL